MNVKYEETKKNFHMKSEIVDIKPIRYIHEDGDAFTSEHCFCSCTFCGHGMLVLIESFRNPNFITFTVHKACDK